MTMAPAALRDSVRFLAITLTLALLYLGLQQVWFTLTTEVVRAGLHDPGAEDRWQDEARALVALSGDAETRLDPLQRQNAWRVGFLLGRASQLTGAVSRSSPETQAAARQLVTPWLEQANIIARAMNVAPVGVIPVTTLEQFAALNQRVENDELGLGARIESEMSARHRHLYLLGMHVGILTEELASAVDMLPNAKPDLIGRHATLAGVPPELWRPLARLPAGANKEEIRQRYQAAAVTLDHALTTVGAAAPQPPGPR